MSAIASVAVSAPGPTGKNVTVIVQTALGASEVPQVVALKSTGLAPPKVMPVIVRVALPVFVKVKGWVVLAPRVWAVKLTLVVETVARGALPVPVRLKVCGLPPALSEMLTMAVRLPVACGAKVT